MSPVDIQATAKIRVNIDSSSMGFVVTLPASRCDGNRDDLTTGPRGHRSRCVPTDERAAPAAIRRQRKCATSGLAFAGGVLDIAGVSRVHPDVSRRTIHVFYDGEGATVENVHRLLAAASWGDAGHEK